MLGQVFSFPSRPWLSALPLGVPSHPPVPGPARSPTFVISWGHHLVFFAGLVDAASSAVCASSWKSRRVTHRGSNQETCFAMYRDSPLQTGRLSLCSAADCAKHIECFLGSQRHVFYGVFEARVGTRDGSPKSYFLKGKVLPLWVDENRFSLF